MAVHVGLHSKDFEAMLVGPEVALNDAVSMPAVGTALEFRNWNLVL